MTIFYLGYFFAIPPIRPPTPESPQNLNFFPCLTPPSVLGLKTWDLFCFVQNLVLYESTIHLYQFISLKKCFEN